MRYFLHCSIDFNVKWLYTSQRDNKQPGGSHEEEQPLDGIRLETGTKDINGWKVLDVSGEIDVYTAPQFKEAVNQLINAGQKDLIIDMSRVTYMDSSGFGTLLSATKRLRPEGGSVNLVACNSAIDRMLRITRLNTIFGTFQTIEEAMRELTKESE